MTNGAGLTVSSRWFFGVAVVLLAVALGIDLGFTQPRLAMAERLKAERSEMAQEMSRSSEHEIRVRDLAGLVGVDELDDLLEEREDPLKYLGRALDRSGLTRLELTTTESGNVGHVRRTQFTLRVLGSYGRILGFVRDLERGTRLVTVDALRIEVMVGQTSLEGRLSLSIYDPKAGT